MSHKTRKYVHPKRDQLELLVFFVSFSSTFLSPCSFVQLHPSSMPATRAQATNERTNERTRERAQRRRRRNRRYPRLSAPPFASSLERASEIGRGREEQAVYRAAICRESFSKQCKCSTTSPPPPLSALPHSLAPPSRSRDKRASMLALESENEPRNAAPTTVHRDNCSPVKRHPT